MRLLALGEITEAWEVSFTRVYSRLTPLQRPGQKPYYSEAEARAQLGEPVHPLKVGRIGSPKPACPSWREFLAGWAEICPPRTIRQIDRALSESRSPLLEAARKRRRSPFPERDAILERAHEARRKSEVLHEAVSQISVRMATENVAIGAQR